MKVLKRCKVLAFFLALSLAFGCIPTSALAETADVNSAVLQTNALSEAVLKVAEPLRDHAASDQLALLWDKLAAIEVVQLDGEDESDEMILAALEGRQSTDEGVVRAFALVGEELGIPCAIQDGAEGQPVVVVDVGDSSYILDVAAGIPGQYPWLASESTDGTDAQQNTGDEDSTDETSSLSTVATDLANAADGVNEAQVANESKELTVSSQAEAGEQLQEEEALSKQSASSTDLSSATVKVANQLYTGKEVKPSIEVVLGGKTLVAGTDYIASYSNNVAAGTAKVTVSGAGNYSGSKAAEFKIVKPSISYGVHVQTYGDQSTRKDGGVAGTSGQSKRLESIKINIGSGLPVTGGVTYRTHVQTYGWENSWRSNGTESGTHGQSKRLEAIQIKLTGDVANTYDVYYRVHAQRLGWMSWAKNGEVAGTHGLAWRLEAIQVMLVLKGDSAPTTICGVKSNFGSAEYANPGIAYRAHTQSYGWMDWVSNGATSGVVGQSKRAEALEVKLGNDACSGGVQYCSYVQAHGRQDWRSNGETSGSTGSSKRIEAVRIRLTGKVSEYFNVWYRVHVQSYGWLDWTSNGAKAGTTGFAKRVESVQVKLLPKTEGAPGSTSRPYVVNSQMSNSPLVCYTALSPNHSGTRNHSIDTITPHYMGDDYSVEKCGEIFAPVSRQASSNYGIGSDGRVALYCDEWNRSWCSSNGANDHRAVTIECANKSDTSLTASCWSSLVRLCTDICERNGKTRLVYRGSVNYDGLSSTDCLLTMHKWFANTACPGAWFSARFAQLADEVNANLS